MACCLCGVLLDEAEVEIGQQKEGIVEVTTKVKQKAPWDLAKETGKTIITPVMGPMIGVYYPYRKTGDLYVALKGEPVFCCQCDAKFPLSELSQHIDNHDRRKRHQQK